MRTRSELIQISRERNRKLPMEFVMMMLRMPRDLTCWHFGEDVPVEERHAISFITSMRTFEFDSMFSSKKLWDLVVRYGIPQNMDAVMREEEKRARHNINGTLWRGRRKLRMEFRAQ